MTEGKRNLIAGLLSEYDIYGFEVREGMISDITDKLLPEIENWQNRPLSAVYPVILHFSFKLEK